MTAASTSDRNSLSPRVVGMPRTPTRSTSGRVRASQIIVASTRPTPAKKAPVAGVQAIQAMFSTIAS